MQLKVIALELNKAGGKLVRSTFNTALITKEYQETSASLTEIAKYHGINYNTLKSYARRHKWQKHKRITKRLDRQYSPEYYSDIPHRIMVYSFAIALFKINKTTAYQLTYGCSKTTARVNSYRLLRRDDTKYMLYYGNLLHDAYSTRIERLKAIKIAYYGAYLDAERIKSKLDQDAWFNHMFGSNYRF